MIPIHQKQKEETLKKKIDVCVVQAPAMTQFRGGIREVFWRRKGKAGS